MHNLVLQRQSKLVRISSLPGKNRWILYIVLPRYYQYYTVTIRQTLTRERENISDLKIFLINMNLQIQIVITCLVINISHSFVFQDSSDSPGEW